MVDHARGAVTRRVVALGEFTFDSPLHLGGGDDRVVDLGIYREPDDGPIVLSGASIAGPLRAYLARRRSKAGRTPSIDEEDPLLRRLFGDPIEPGSTDADEQQSALTIHEAALKAEAPSRRDAVKIDPIRGTASDGAKYDLEALEPGAAGRFAFTLTIREGHATEADDLLLMFQAALDALSGGEVRFGAFTRRGFGKLKAGFAWKVYDYDMRTTQDAIAWACSTLFDDMRPPASGVQARVADRAPDLEPLRRVSITVSLALRSSLLVRAPAKLANGDTGPDVVQFESGGVPVVPAKSWAGPIRARCRAIALTLGLPDAEARIARLFGPLHGGRGRGEHLYAGRVSVEESRLTAVEPISQSRVKINRFTGGASNGALFSERAVWAIGRDNEAITLTCSIDDPEPEDAMLVLHAIRDLCLEDLPIGGETGIGRGVLAGIKLTLQDRGSEWVWARIGDTMRLTSGDREAFLTKYQTPWLRQLREREGRHGN